MDNNINFQQVFNDNFNELIELLKIKSIYDEKSISEDAPYGKGVKDALLFMSSLATKDGFNVKNYDNQVITINYCDKPNNRFDIASHLDVVSVDDSWSSDPFNPQVVNGKLYGRGTTDMKTAAFLTYLALKLLKERYPETKNEIRLVLGSDEERTMNDMRYYVSKVPAPLFSFSPDGIFPMCIAEKGALMWTLNGEYDGIIESFHGGVQCNVVPPICEATLKNNQYTKQISEYIIKNKIDAEVKEKDNKTFINVKGIAVHSSLNFLGRSAIIVCLDILKNVCNDKLAENLFNLFSDNYGQGLGVKKENEDIYLTVNLGKLEIEKNKIFGQVDGRYPFNLNSSDLTSLLEDKCIINVSLDYDDLPTGCDENDEYVKVLLNTYQDITNDNTKPFVSGGVSYSKVFNHSVTFGPVHLSKEQMAHQKDEYIEIEDAIKALEIYYKTFEKLAFM